MASPSPEPTLDRPKRANFRLPWEIVVAPVRAYERIEAAPEWLLSFGIVVALALASALLEFPAASHLVAHTTSTLGAAADLTPATILERLLAVSVMTSLSAIILTALSATLFVAMRDLKKLGSYWKLLSLATNVAIIGAIGGFLQAIAIALHPAASFTDLRSLAMALPIDLTFLSAKNNPAQAEFLGHFGLFDTWQQIVFAFGLSRLGRVPVTNALVFTFALDLVLALVQ